MTLKVISATGTI